MTTITDFLFIKLCPANWTVEQFKDYHKEIFEKSEKMERENLEYFFNVNNYNSDHSTSDEQFDHVFNKKQTK